jgi:hypothetical protein
MAVYPAENMRELSTMAIIHQLSDIGLVQEDWSETLCTAPSVIVIMGESMVLAAVPNAAQVRIQGHHLRSVDRQALTLKESYSWTQAEPMQPKG